MSYQISRSGFYQDNVGRSFLITQGHVGYTLITNKQVLFRLYLNQDTISQMLAILALITMKSGQTRVSKSFLLPLGSLGLNPETDPTTPHGPSIGIGIGFFPYPGLYDVKLFVLGQIFPPLLLPLVVFEIPDLHFSPSGRIRMLIHFIQGSAPSRNFLADSRWYYDMIYSLERFAYMLPVRDGIIDRLDDPNAGLCYKIGSVQEAWPDEVGIPLGDPRRDYMRETNQINSRGGPEHVDATVLWRPVQPRLNEEPGGIALYNSLPGPANFVGGYWHGIESTAPIMAQEVGHLFGLEPPGSPHYQHPLDAKHSKDSRIIDPFAYDFYNYRPYEQNIWFQYGPNRRQSYIGDPMNNYGGWQQGRDSVLYSAYDWEHLRQKFLNLPGILQGITEGPNPSESGWNKLLAGSPKINLPSPEMTLSPKDGYQWDWTIHGFQRFKVDGKIQRESGFTPHVEGIFSAIRNLGVDEVYTPIDKNLMSAIFNPNGNYTRHVHGEYDHDDHS
jgi:hypothetical protein